MIVTNLVLITSANLRSARARKKINNTLHHFHRKTQPNSATEKNFFLKTVQTYCVLSAKYFTNCPVLRHYLLCFSLFRLKIDFLDPPAPLKFKQIFEFNLDYMAIARSSLDTPPPQILQICNPNHEKLG
jgi:hypothetical protein